MRTKREINLGGSDLYATRDHVLQTFRIMRPLVSSRERQAVVIGVWHDPAQGYRFRTSHMLVLPGHRPYPVAGEGLPSVQMAIGVAAAHFAERMRECLRRTGGYPRREWLVLDPLFWSEARADHLDLAGIEQAAAK